MFRGRAIAWLLGAAGMLVASPALANEQVKLNVVVIHATKTAKAKDPALRKVHRSLEKTFGHKFKGFKQLDRTAMNLNVGGTGDLNLPNGSAAQFTYKGAKGKQHNLKFSVPKDKVDISLRAPLNKLFYHAGMRFGSGDDKGILILALYLRAP